MTDKLTIEEVDGLLSGILKPGSIIAVPNDWNNYPDVVKLLSVCGQVTRQLADTMRENERLQDHIILSADTHIKELLNISNTCDAMKAENERLRSLIAEHNRKTLATPLGQAYSGAIDIANKHSDSVSTLTEAASTQTEHPSRESDDTPPA